MPQGIAASVLVVTGSQVIPHGVITPHGRKEAVLKLTPATTQVPSLEAVRFQRQYMSKHIHAQAGVEPRDRSCDSESPVKPEDSCTRASGMHPHYLRSPHPPTLLPAWTPAFEGLLLARALPHTVLLAEKRPSSCFAACLSLQNRMPLQPRSEPSLGVLCVSAFPVTTLTMLT